MIKPLTITKLLQSQGFGSRRDCRALVQAGRLHIDGKQVDNPDAEYLADGLVMQVDGVNWPYHATVYLMLNKPAGYECSRAPKHHPSVLELLPMPLRQREVQPVGRLDEDTRGLLLLTDDGELHHRLISPKHKVVKVYEVSAKHLVEDDQIMALLAGVQLHDEPAPIAAAACVRVSERVIHLSLTEGKYHQVKRMLAAAGNRVETLKRITIGSLQLPDDLPEGSWRWLDKATIIGPG